MPWEGLQGTGSVSENLSFAPGVPQPGLQQKLRPCQMVPDGTLAERGYIFHQPFWNSPSRAWELQREPVLLE